MTGQQINLDNLSTQYAMITDDWRFPCRQITVTFQSPNILDFDNTTNNYITFGKSNWVPFSVKETVGGNCYNYTLNCFPQNAYIKAKTCLASSSEFAQALNVSLQDDSSNQQFMIPTKERFLCNLAIQHRWQSMMQNYNNLEDSLFMYFDSTVLYSNTWKTMLKQKAKEYTAEPMSNPVVTYWDNRFDDQYLIDKIGSQSYLDGLKKAMKRIITIESQTPASLFSLYTFGQKNWHEDLPTMLCIGATIDSRKSPNNYHISFGEFNNE